jgi:histidine triad (HIT) family protein
MTDCLFCKIATHALPVKAVHEDDVCFIFADISPQAPTHLLVIPKAHYDHAEGAPPAVLGHLLKCAALIGADRLPDGYRIVTNTGADGGQSVNHLHFHLLGGRPMGWPPG